jgi:hypothetical protein
MTLILNLAGILRQESKTMSNEQLAVCNEKKKICFDCLHCKVSVKSTNDCLLCYCAKTSAKEPHTEEYWLENEICQQFYDMSA